MCNHSKKSFSTDFVYYKVNGRPIEIEGNKGRVWKFPPALESYYVVETRVYETCVCCGVLLAWNSSMENMTASGAKKLGFEFAGDDPLLKWAGKVAIRGARSIK